MDKQEVVKIAEQCLREMLKADDTADFELYTKRYEKKYLEGFSPKQFMADVKEMRLRNGKCQKYKFLCMLRNGEFDGLTIYRTVWKGIYEKRDAVIELALYEKNGEWHVIQSSVY